MYPPDLNFLFHFFHICVQVQVKEPLPPGDNPIAVNKYYYYIILITKTVTPRLRTPPEKHA
jgi:hypothetical protein